MEKGSNFSSSTIFYNLILDFCVKTRTRFSLRDKRLLEIIEVEIMRVDCTILLQCFFAYRGSGKLPWSIVKHIIVLHELTANVSVKTADLKQCFPKVWQCNIYFPEWYCGKEIHKCMLQYTLLVGLFAFKKDSLENLKKMNILFCNLKCQNWNSSA